MATATPSNVLSIVEDIQRLVDSPKLAMTSSITVGVYISNYMLFC